MCKRLKDFGRTMLLQRQISTHIDPFAATDSDMEEANNEMFIIEDDDDIEIYIIVKFIGMIGP